MLSWPTTLTSLTPISDLITAINAKIIIPITFLHVDNLYHGSFQGQDSQGIRRVLVDFQDVSVRPFSISWDSLALHHLKIINIKILQDHAPKAMVMVSTQLGSFIKLAKWIKVYEWETTKEKPRDYDDDYYEYEVQEEDLMWGLDIEY